MKRIFLISLLAFTIITTGFCQEAWNDYVSQDKPVYHADFAADSTTINKWNTLSIEQNWAPGHVQSSSPANSPGIFLADEGLRINGAASKDFLVTYINLPLLKFEQDMDISFEAQSGISSYNGRNIRFLYFGGLGNVPDRMNEVAVYGKYAAFDKLTIARKNNYFSCTPENSIYGTFYRQYDFNAWRQFTIRKIKDSVYFFIDQNFVGKSLINNYGNAFGFCSLNDSCRFSVRSFGVSLIKKSGLPQVHQPLPNVNDKIALILANSSYANLVHVPNAKNDLDSLARKLTQRGFTVDTLSNFSKDQLENTLAAFKAKAKGKQLAMIYYAGHAYEKNSVSYMLPVNAPSMNDSSFYSDAYRINMNEVISALSSAGCDKSVFVLDACRDYPARSANNGEDILYRGLHPVPDNKISDYAIIYSTQPGKPAEDGQTENSPFCQAFLSILDQDNMNFFKMLSDITDKTLKNTRQRQLPNEEISLPAGDFYVW